MTSSVISFLSVWDFFFIATSSLTYGFFVTSASSLFNGIFISSGDCTGGLCASVWPLAGLLSMLTSSLVRGTSTVLVSFTGFLVTVDSSSCDFLETSSLSSVKGILYSSVSFFFFCSIRTNNSFIGGSSCCCWRRFILIITQVLLRESKS